MLWRSLRAGARSTTSHLLLIVSKTKETVVDFGRAPPTPCPLAIYGEEVATVREYKYLGSIINAKSYWSPNALVFLKGNQQLYLMKQLKPFSICPKLLELFFNNLCHFSSLKDQDMAKLSMVTKTTSRQSGRPVLDFQAHFCKIQQIDQLLGQDELVPFISCCHCPQWSVGDCSLKYFFIIMACVSACYLLF